MKGKICPKERVVDLQFTIEGNSFDPINIEVPVSIQPKTDDTKGIINDEEKLKVDSIDMS